MRRLFFLAAFVWGIAASARAQVSYGAPPGIITPASGLVVSYSQGVMTQGGATFAMNAGTVTLVDNQTNCQAPQFPLCNIIYWSSGSVLQVTQSPVTAFQAGNIVLAYITTTNGNVTQNIPATASQAVVSAQQPSSVTTMTIAPPTSFGYLPLPLCNALVKVQCQPSAATLSGR